MLYPLEVIYQYYREYSPFLYFDFYSKSEELQVLEPDNLIKMYRASFKSSFTARAYTTHLKKYANGDLVSLLTNQTQREAEDRLIQFIITNKEKGMAWGALHNYVAAVA